MKPVTNYEVIDHGIEGDQYFQGCGVSHTQFTDVSTGIGETFKEAFNDALDCLAQCDWDTETVKMPKMRKGRPLTVSGYLRSIGVKPEEAESNYRVSVRVK